ncbi:DUF2807 domain-containing protein [Hymenobacter sp. BT175]|uniref:GIN domain-containing protein n=1 Tax=Hymenobacter translucens TaxID=2886507 RepID=UPI001D0F0C0B|nr:DUF2807 domain-containing protein [Hymenobacter translucens]MCC2545271.1 DUF2807 domain-containing protein [Hymenobacter translucens]
MLLGAAGSLLLPGCGEGHETDCLMSTGTVVTEQRALPAFTTIYAYDNVDVTLVQDQLFYAEVRAGKNLQSSIELTTQGDELTIHNTSRCNWVRTYNTPREVTLHVPDLRNVFLKGQGHVRTAGNFRADTIFFHLVGAGDYDLDLTSRYLWLDQYEVGDIAVRGSAQELNLTVGGNGSLRGTGLRVRDLYFHLTKDSGGDASVTATNVLAGRHNGIGTLYYAGSPAQTSITLGPRGKVVKRD